MSSPSNNSLSPRRIAPLPVRPRSSNGRVGGSQNLGDSQRMSPDSSIRTLHGPSDLPSSNSRPPSYHPIDNRSVPILGFTPTPGTSPSPSPMPTPGSRRNSSASFISDESDVPAPYDVEDEQTPEEPFFSPAFQNALQGGLGIASSIAEAIETLGGSSELGKDLSRLAADAKELSTFDSCDTRTIAVLGDSGEGKSSVINSLLHYPEIAKTGDIGAACTSVVTEYRQKTNRYPEPITIEVEYLSMEGIEELIKELVWNYRQLFLPDIEEDKVDAKDYARYQRESEQAWSALKAAFKHQREFNKNMLSDTSDGALEKVTQQLIQWTHGLTWPDGNNSGMWKSTAHTAQECCEKTSVFMEDKFWPFTKIIRIYLHAKVLKAGIVLADLPGLQDTNLARVKATQKYLMKCDHVLIVAKISRAITDQSLKSSLYTVLKRHAPLEWEESAAQSLKLAVVCTKAEDINQATARRDFCGPNLRIASSVMDDLDKEIRDAKNVGSRALKKTLKRKQESLMVDARNNHVKEGLQNAYASKVPGGRLEVFCVSNTWYEKFCATGNHEMVYASGIPELRQFCHSITASAQLLEAKHFLHSTLSSLLSSVELWAHSSPTRSESESIEPDESIYLSIENIHEEVSEAIDHARSDFKQSFTELLLDFLEQRNEIWERAGEKKGLEWFSVRNPQKRLLANLESDTAQWHWSQYNAWCVNGGSHYTAKRGAVNWNSELIWKMRMELAFQWDLLEEEVPNVFNTLSQSIKQQLLLLKDAIEASGFTLPLVEGIDYRIRDVEYKLRLAQQEFVRKIRLIRHTASEPTEGSYIVNEMIPAYRSVSLDRGAGRGKRAHSTVQGRITNGTLFPNISTAISKDVGKVLRKIFRGVRATMDAVFGLISNDVEMALNVSDGDGEGNEQEEQSVDNEWDEALREELAAKVKELKARHDEFLKGIAEIE